MHISFESLCVREKTLKVLPTKLLVIYTQLLFYFFNIIYIYIYKKVRMFSKKSWHQDEVSQRGCSSLGMPPAVKPPGFHFSRIQPRI